MLVKLYKSVKECAMNIRQRKLASKKTHSSRYNAAKGKPTKNVKEMCDYRRSRKEAVVLRKAAHLFRSKEKHMAAYATSEWVEPLVPSYYDGFVGSEADIDFRKGGGGMGEPILPDLNVVKRCREWGGSWLRREWDYDEWMFARDVHHENLMQWLDDATR
jgi:hypothetical protein